MKTSIPNKFDGETAVVVATGPSINKEQISAISDEGAHYIERKSQQTVRS